MVAHRTLTPFVRVQILHPLPLGAEFALLRCIFLHNRHLSFQSATCFAGFAFFHANISIYHSNCTRFVPFDLQIKIRCCINNCHCKLTPLSAILAGTATTLCLDGADYVWSSSGILPDYYITKDAPKAGVWKTRRENLREVFSYMQIGGDVFLLANQNRRTLTYFNRRKCFMKVLVFTGSPHENGITAALADEFCRGAEEAGHELMRFDTAKLDIHPCKGCFTCHTDGGECVYQDDMKYIWPHLLSADVIALVTPLYYFGMTAQLKTAVDRFFPVNEQLKALPKKACLIAACGNQNQWIAEGLQASYTAMCRHLDLEDVGRVISFACRDTADLASGGYLDAARTLGLNV